jgi:hypothetical protein
MNAIDVKQKDAADTPTVTGQQLPLMNTCGVCMQQSNANPAFYIWQFQK